MAVEYPVCQYRLDQSDRIVWVDDFWLAFARENGAGLLTRETIYGKPIWEFVADDLTRELYQDIHTRIRYSGSSMVIPFRCDSPSMRRYMQLTISGAETGEIRYDSLLLKAEPQRWVALLDTNGPRSRDTLTLCSCCKRVVTESCWSSLEDVYVSQRIFEAKETPQLQYTVCPNCTRDFHAPPVLIE